MTSTRRCPAPAPSSSARRSRPAPGWGTVDKVQGQEAPIAIYSMATSTADEAPHEMEFLYSLHRLNVATSRARGVAAIIANPRSP